MSTPYGGWGKPATGYTVLRIPAIKSPNFVTTISGWTINQDGSAEFNNLTIRGTFFGTSFIFDKTGLYVYSGTPASGNLTESIGITSATVDPLGLNAVLPGDTRYHSLGGVFVAQQSTQSFVADLWQASAAAGPYTEMKTNISFTNEFTVQPVMELTGKRIQLNGVPPGGGSTASLTIIPPSGDTTGATDIANIHTELTNGNMVQLLPGTYYVNAVLEFPGGAVIRGASPQETIIQATAAMNAVLASTGWNASANTASQGPVHLSGFRVDANSLATHGIVSQNFWSYFTDLECINSAGGDDFRLDAFGQNGTTEFNAGVTAVENHITNCQFRNPGTGGACFRSHDSIVNQHFTDGWLTDCVMQGAGSSATVPLVQIDTLAGWKVDGNHLYGAGVGAMSGQRLFNTRVVNNYIEPWGTSTTAGGWGGMAFDGIADGGFGSSVIANNTLAVNATTPGNAASTIDGISCRVTSGNTGGLSITGNTISNPEPVAAHYRGAITVQTQNAAAVMNVVTTGNQVGSGWTNTVDVITNGGTINHTAGV